MGYILLAMMAAAGFFASVVCHLTAWLQIEPPLGKAVFVLHVGLFVLWFPLVFFANRTMPKPGRGNFDHLLAVMPKWVRTFAYGLFVYALLNFAYFLFSTHKYPRNEVPFPVELRGFSGHWIMFYGIAAVGFIALARLRRSRGEKKTLG